MRSEFDKELHTMHKELMGMGASCERAIALAASSITNGRPELTDEVRAAEEDIDRAERSIEALCMRLLLRQQPVATDLRNISAALKMISDLERVGDYAMDIVELSPYLSAAQLSGKAHLAEMALAAVDMVKQSVQAFVDGDVQLAARVKEQDDKVDELFDKVKEEAVELIRTGSLEAHAAPVVEGDSSKIQQVFYNLIDNAIKYTPAGGDVRVELGENARFAIIKVSDTGIGIPQADIAHIFDRFYRVDKARSRETGGTGLGLSIVNQIVQLHGGQVSVQSVEDKGSVFTVTLPK